MTQRALVSILLVSTVSLVACVSPSSVDPGDGTEDSAAEANTAQPLVVAPGADLRITTFGQTSQTTVDGYQQFRVTVRNFGNADSNPTTLAVTLLQTQTSPSSYLLGNLQAVPSGCSLSGRTLSCALGRLRNNGPQGDRERTVTFGYRIPVTTQARVLTASVAGTGEPAANATDNSATLTAGVTYRAVAVTAGTKSAQHCTGTNLTAYFECTTSPSSISSHDADYHADGTITFAGEPTFSGIWSQPDPTRLHFEYRSGGYAVAVFDGFGADGSCFEGITRFYDDPNPNDAIPPVLSSYNAPYRVCF